MNHFELFNLPVVLDINLDTLKAEFLKLQQQYHPDKAAISADKVKKLNAGGVSIKIQLLKCLN